MGLQGAPEYQAKELEFSRTGAMAQLLGEPVSGHRSGRGRCGPGEGTPQPLAELDKVSRDTQVQSPRAWTIFAICNVIH